MLLQGRGLFSLPSYYRVLNPASSIYTILLLFPLTTYPCILHVEIEVRHVNAHVFILLANTLYDHF